MHFHMALMGNAHQSLFRSSAELVALGLFHVYQQPSEQKEKEQFIIQTHEEKIELLLLFVGVFSVTIVRLLNEPYHF